MDAFDGIGAIPDEQQVLLNMAGVSLTQFVGFETLADFADNAALLEVNFTADRILAVHEAGFLHAHAQLEESTSFARLVECVIERFVGKEHRAQVAHFFSEEHIIAAAGNGLSCDSVEFTFEHDEGDVHWVRATYCLHPAAPAVAENSAPHVCGSVLIMDITRSRAKELSLTTMAMHDGLTGLYNRITAADLIEEYLRENPDGPAALAVLDVDKFKQINDVYGHECGDRVLLAFADEMQERFAPGTVVSRTGGDEFLLFFPDTGADEAERQIAAFAEREHDGFEHEGRTVRFNTSVGYCAFPDQARDYEELTARADEAMYAAKMADDVHHMAWNNGIKREQRGQMGFNIRDLTNSMPGAMLVYEADGGEKILFANKELVQLFGCTDLEDFMDYTGGSFGGIVHPDDRDRVNHEIWAQIDGERTGSLDYCRYRIVAKDGTLRHVEDYGRLVQDDHYGRVFYVAIHDEDARDSWIAGV